MFRRRSTPDPAARTASSRTGGSATGPTDDSTTGRAGRKGRPTPKRREAERERRKKARAPRDRKEAYRQSRARAREERARMRRALTTGDERNLPPRDQGPVKAFARDYVDSRRRGGELFLPGAVIVFLLSWFPDPRVKFYGFLLWFVLILFVAFDSIRVVIGVKREAARRFPQESPRGLGAYVVMRALQFRKFRLPPPRVKPGTRI